MLRSVAACADAVRAGRISPVEVVREALGQIEAWQPATNAFSQLRPEESIGEARRLADLLARGEEPGPLAGVPLAVKDLFDVAGWETTGCCAGYRGRVASRDAPVVAALRRAGAVVVGKTNQHELAAGATNLVSACGPTRNPWDPGRLTGGSSGGSAAAVSAGCAPLALGTDTGGSVRIPASFCGITALKPTHGALSLEGVMPLAPSLDTVGAMAVAAADIRMAQATLAGPGPPGESSAPRRVGIATDDVARAVTPEVRQALEGVAEWVGVGARPLPPGLLEAYRPGDWEAVAWRELYEAHAPLLDERASVADPTRALLERGRDTSADQVEDARTRMRRLREGFLEQLREVDAVLLPATPFPAPELERREIEVDGRTVDVRRGAISVLTRPINLAGLPAVAFPAGFSEEGLPVGVQAVGAPGSELRLLELAEAWQRDTDLHLRVPWGTRADGRPPSS